MSKEKMKQEILRVMEGISAEEKTDIFIELLQEIMPIKDHEATPEEKEPAKSYLIVGRSVEEMDAAATKYEESKQGGKFEKRLKNARKFLLNANEINSISLDQLEYISNKNYNNLINGSLDLYALGFRSGALWEGKKARA